MNIIRDELKGLSASELLIIQMDILLTLDDMIKDLHKSKEK